MTRLCLLVDLKHCTDEYITRFLLARKYRTEQAAALIVAYQAQVAHRQDIFGNLTARDPALQRALRAGIPGVLPARDRYSNSFPAFARLYINIRLAGHCT